MDPLESTQPNSAETMTAAGRARDVDAEPITGIRLEIVGGPMDGVTADVHGDTLVIGRSPQCDLCLHIDPQASAIHARIAHDGKGYWLEDLNSRNGTYVGEMRIRERTLIGPGTLFVLGLTSLEFVPLGGTQSL